MDIEARTGKTGPGTVDNAQGAPGAREREAKRKADLATFWGAWLTAATLLFLIAQQAGGCHDLSEVKSARTEVSVQQLTERSGDHETRIRGLESGVGELKGQMGTMNSKLDRILDHFGIAGGAGNRRETP